MSDVRTRTCSQCGYDLTGLPGLEGTCPECGQFWDVMTGRGLGDLTAQGRRRSYTLLNRVRTILILAFTLCVMVCGGLASLIASNPWRPIALAGFIALVGLLAAVTSYFYEDQ